MSHPSDAAAEADRLSEILNQVRFRMSQIEPTKVTMRNKNIFKEKLLVIQELSEDYALGMSRMVRNYPCIEDYLKLQYIANRTALLRSVQENENKIYEKLYDINLANQPHLCVAKPSAVQPQQVGHQPGLKEQGEPDSQQSQEATHQSEIATVVEESAQNSHIAAVILAAGTAAVKADTAKDEAAKSDFSRFKAAKANIERSESAEIDSVRAKATRDAAVKDEIARNLPYFPACMKLAMLSKLPAIFDSRTMENLKSIVFPIKPGEAFHKQYKCKFMTYKTLLTTRADQFQLLHHLDICAGGHVHQVGKDQGDVGYLAYIYPTDLHNQQAEDDAHYTDTGLVGVLEVVDHCDVGYLAYMYSDGDQDQQNNNKEKVMKVNYFKALTVEFIDKETPSVEPVLVNLTKLVLISCQDLLLRPDLLHHQSLHLLLLPIPAVAAILGWTPTIGITRFSIA